MSLVMFRFLYEMCLILPTYLSLLIRNMKPGFHWFLSFIFFAPCFWISSPVPGVVYLWWLYWLRMEYGFSSLDPCVEPPEYKGLGTLFYPLTPDMSITDLYAHGHLPFSTYKPILFNIHPTHSFHLIRLCLAAVQDARLLAWETMCISTNLASSPVSPSEACDVGTAYEQPRMRVWGWFAVRRPMDGGGTTWPIMRTAMVKVGTFLCMPSVRRIPRLQLMNWCHP